MLRNVLKQKKNKTHKSNAYGDLCKAIEELKAYSESIKDHSNYELLQMADKIRSLFSDQD